MQSMQGLRSRVLSFSKELEGFSQELCKSVDDLKRTAQPKPCVGATAFRGSLEDLKQQTSTLNNELSQMERATQDDLSLEDLLGHCIAQLNENNRRVESLEKHLRNYGYRADFVPPSEPAAQKVEEAEPELSPEPKGIYLWDEPLRRRSYSLPGNLSDEVLGLKGADLPDSRQVTVTPSPCSFGAPSIPSMSPSLRELQLKYGRVSLSDSSPEAAMVDLMLPRPAESLLNDLAAPEATPISSTGGQAIVQAAQTPFSSLKIPSKWQDAGGKASEAVMNTPVMGGSNLNPARGALTVNTGRRIGSIGDAAGSPKSVSRGGNNTPMGKSDMIASRLALGEAPWDMLSLKAAITNAAPGTGEIGKAIGSASFHPQAAAFTSLLHMCAKHKLWEKALEVFDAMKRFHPSVVPNTVHFSSLISACGTAGQWQEAMRVFEEMKLYSLKDPQCAPNVITYSALMTACCAGGRPDKANEAFLDMKARGVQPDHISYSTLIAGYERWGDLEKAKSLFEELRESGLLQKGPPSKIPTYLEQFSRKLQRTQSKSSMDEEGPVKGDIAGHRAWHSFSSNAASADSPCIGAHYGTSSLSRKPSNELVNLDNEPTGLQHVGSPSHASFADKAGPGAFQPSMAYSMAQQTPVHSQPLRQPATPSMGTSQLHQQAGRGSMLRGGMRQGTPGPLSHSFDSHMQSHQGSYQLPAPPGFPAVDPFKQAVVEPQHMRYGVGLQQDPKDAKGSQNFDVAALNQLASTSGIDIDTANQLLSALVQQQAMAQQQQQQQQVGSPLAPMQQAAFTAPPTAVTTKAANGALQIQQISVEEYNNLPLRFSRQLAFDQMNEAVDYINAIVEGKMNNKEGNDHADGVTPNELVPLNLGSTRTTALLNCLLQLKRVRLTVRNGQQLCQLLAAE